MFEIKNELLKPIINACGEKAQKIQTIEELSELTKALCKSIKNDTMDVRESVTEEMADVIIMVSQMVIVYDNGADIKKIINDKIERTYKRLGLEAQ